MNILLLAQIMNTLLWALQVILAIKLLTAAFNHGLRSDPSKMKRGMQSLGAWTGPALKVIALVTLITALALVLPAAGEFLPFTASFTALLMLAASGLHLRCRVTPRVWVSLILFGMAAFLAYGRGVILPL
jgi:hypothetical protein